MEHMKKKQPRKPKNPLVVLQVLPSLVSGGVERGTIEIAKAAKAHGITPIVVSSGGHMVHQLQYAHITHITLPVSSKNPFIIWRNISRLEKIIKEHHVDIIHARSRAPAWSAYFAAKKTGIRFFTTFHGTYSIHNPLKGYYNSIMAKGEKVIAISEFIRSHIMEEYKLDEKCIEVIPRGVDLNHFSPEKVNSHRLLQILEKLKLPEDKKIILLPGRFARWKGHATLLEALVHLPKEDYFCVLAGDYNKNPSYRKELEQLIHKLHLSESVRIIGNQNDMPALYSAVNIVVSASHSQPEAFGRTIVEAQAMGKMVIATRHGGACETVIDNKTGWLVEPGNAGEMAEALLKALKLPEKQRKIMAAHAQKHIAGHFSLTKMTERTLSLYDQVHQVSA